MNPNEPHTSPKPQTQRPPNDYSDYEDAGLLLWCSGLSSWLQIQRSRVRFLALPHFLRNGGSGTGTTQPHEDVGLTERKSDVSGLENRD
jgi:hypothetical protein